MLPRMARIVILAIAVLFGPALEFVTTQSTMSTHSPSTTVKSNSLDGPGPLSPYPKSARECWRALKKNNRINDCRKKINGSISSDIDKFKKDKVGNSTSCDEVASVIKCVNEAACSQCTYYGAIGIQGWIRDQAFKKDVGAVCPHENLGKMCQEGLISPSPTFNPSHTSKTKSGGFMIIIVIIILLLVIVAGVVVYCLFFAKSDKKKSDPKSAKGANAPKSNAPKSKLEGNKSQAPGSSAGGGKSAVKSSVSSGGQAKSKVKSSVSSGGKSKSAVSGAKSQAKSIVSKGGSSAASKASAKSASASKSKA